MKRQGNFAKLFDLQALCACVCVHVHVCVCMFACASVCVCEHACQVYSPDVILCS